MEDSVFSPKQWQTAGLSSSLNPNSIDQVEDREMAGWNKRRIKVTGSFTGSWAVRDLADAVLFEFSSSRQQDLASRDRIPGGSRSCVCFS